jgi:PAS domain S-box-containing protein
MKLAIVAISIAFATNFAYAAQLNGAGAQWGDVALAAMGGGGIAALLMLGARRRETHANAGKLEADAISTSTETIAKLITQVDKLLADVAVARSDARAAESRASASEEQVRQLSKRLARVEEIASMAVAANRLQDYREFVDLFDLIPTPAVFSSAIDGGRWDWVNLAMCRKLGRNRHELLGTSWRDIVLREDLDATKQEEAAAHRRRVWGFRNRFVSSDGSIVAFEWYATVYQKDDGGTIAFAFERPDDADNQRAQHPAARIPVRKRVTS